MLTCSKCGAEYKIYGFAKDKTYFCRNCNALLDTGTAAGKVAGQETIAIPAQPAEGLSPASPPDPFVNKVIGGCRITEKIGQGGMGTVYKATHLALAKTVAVKILPPESTTQAQRDRFVREARTAAQLEHPNIVQMHNVAEEDGYYFIVMQYVEGRTLSQIIRSGEKKNVTDSIRIIRDAAAGLVAAHRKRMIHRDIKPDNIMVTTDGVVKIMDFGLAKSTEAESDITRTGQVLGTPYYMAPEQCGEGTVDHQSDIYSLGVTFYFMLTGHRPFTGDTPLSVMMKHVNDKMPDPKKFNPDLDDRAVTVLEKMMAKDKRDRYDSAEALIEDLNKLSDAFTQKIAPPAEAPVKKGGKGLLIAVVVILVLAGAAAGVYFGVINKKTPSSESDLANDAQKALKALVEKTAGHIDGKEYDIAMALYETFPAEYKPTPSWNRLENDIKTLQDKVKSEYDSALRVTMEHAEKNRFDEAVRVIQPFTRYKTAGIGKKAVEKIAALEDLKKQYLLTAKAMKEKSGQEKLLALGAERAVLAEADGYYKEKEYARAKELYEKLKDSNFNEIKTAADRKYKLILNQESNALDEFTRTAALADASARNGNYDDAIRKLKAFIKRTPYPKNLAEKTGKLIDTHTTAYKSYWKANKDVALTLMQSSDYVGAKMIFQKFVNAAEDSIASEAMNLAASCREWSEFDSARRKAKGLEEKNKFTDAAATLEPFMKSSTTEIADLAAGAVKRIKKKILKELNDKYPGMCYVAGGEYTIGSDKAVDGNPRRKTNLKAFYIGRYEVTNAEYLEFVKTASYSRPRHWNDGKIPAGLENHPVTCVSYEDAEAYAKWAGKRLPTAAEWEAAAGGSAGNRTYPWGINVDPKKCNVRGSGTKSVGSYPDGRSPCGAFDMAGNVLEWTSTVPKNCPAHRVTKGGSFDDRGLSGIRISYVSNTRADGKRSYIGFRCARD
jgi:serine/threonine protein kinase/formylglycine-generating enzyme required for sulfatase activity